MINAILLAVMLAIIVANIVWGPRGYRLLAEAGAVSRKSFYRRMLTAQLVQMTLPPVIGLVLLGRLDAIVTLPVELWPASSLVTGDGPAVSPDPVFVPMFVGAMLAAIPLGALLTWHRQRRGKGVPAYLAHISALLPRDRVEVMLGAAISIAAGVGEELFFRLVLPMALAAYVGGVTAMAVSILLFGIAHSFQGWKGIVSTALVGALLTLLYLMSGVLAIAMLVHATIDLMTLAIRPVIRGAWRATPEPAVTD